ncbi:MAG: hypothetical protein AAFY67_12070 [Cyanobacteria bacterium J06642_9]
MLRIADLEFDLMTVRIEAYCHTEKMQWDIQVECNSHVDGKFHGCKPNLSLGLFETPPEAFSHWTELAPRNVRWLEKNGTDVTPSGILYIFEHTPIFECHARCYNKGGEMQVELDGKCDVYCDEQYNNDLDLHLDSPVVFRGVWFGRHPESDCRNAISHFLDPNDFDYYLTEHGVSMLTPK